MLHFRIGHVRCHCSKARSDPINEDVLPNRGALTSCKKHRSQHWIEKAAGEPETSMNSHRDDESHEQSGPNGIVVVQGGIFSNGVGNDSLMRRALLRIISDLHFGIGIYQSKCSDKLGNHGRTNRNLTPRIDANVSLGFQRSTHVIARKFHVPDGNDNAIIGGDAGEKHGQVANYHLEEALFALPPKKQMDIGNWRSESSPADSLIQAIHEQSYRPHCHTVILKYHSCKKM